MKTREYNMQGRSVSMTETREAIVRAALDTFMAERSFSVALGPIAERAGVSTKTLLRHFGSRDSLIEAAWSQAYQEVSAERTSPPDDPDSALDALIAHYEVRGEFVLGLLAEEDKDPRAKRMTDTGRIGHRAWVNEVFGSQLPDAGSARERALDALVVATDVYAWKLLRLDRGLDVDAVRDRMSLMTTAVLTALRDAGGPSPWDTGRPSP